MSADLKRLLARIDAARSQIEDAKDELRELWEADEFDFEDSMWLLDDSGSLLEEAISLHEVQS
mgnify:CR=1 FL=1|jgi:hypothetical protein